MIPYKTGRRLILAVAGAAAIGPAHADAPMASAAPGGAVSQDAVPNKSAYVFFDQGIDAISARGLRRTLASLVETGTDRITLVLSSSGGQNDPTFETYSFIQALPAQINTHAVGLVESDANILFLAGEKRTADRTAHFMLHPWTVGLPNEATAQAMSENAAKMDAITNIQLAIYRERTRMTEELLNQIQRGKVYLTAEQAREAGMVHAVSDLRIPREGAVKIVQLG